jgi:hypothetical protein
MLARAEDRATLRMWPLIQLFVDIAFHRRGPEDVPAASALFSLVLMAAATVQVASLLALDNDPGRAVLETGAHLLLTLGAYALVLWWRGLAGRFRQTATALLGTGSLLGLAMLPVALWVDAGLRAEAVAPLAMLAFFALLVWSIDIAGFVVSRALGTHYVVGVLVALAVIVADTVLRRQWLPPA